MVDFGEWCRVLEAKTKQSVLAKIIKCHTNLLVRVRGSAHWVEPSTLCAVDPDETIDRGTYVWSDTKTAKIRVISSRVVVKYDVQLVPSKEIYYGLYKNELMPLSLFDKMEIELLAATAQERATSKTKSQPESPTKSANQSGETSSQSTPNGGLSAWVKEAVQKLTK